MKHAYMIIVHTNINQVKKLIKLLDHPSNDIYVHLDLKMKEKLMVRTQFSRLIILENRINVKWGDPSQVICELNLLKEAIRGEYTYYHLISGMDLPLKSQNYIHKFFENIYAQDRERQFIAFDSKKNFSDRVKYFYFPRKIYVRGEKSNKKIHKISNKIIYECEKNSLHIQRFLGVNRLKNYDITNVAKGSNWFSITHEFARYIVDNEELIKKIIKYTDCCDEIIVQTLYLKKFQQVNLSEMGNLRYIDWEKGTPYTFKIEDFNNLIQTDCLFARKFDERIDRKIIDKIILNIQNMEK